MTLSEVRPFRLSPSKATSPDVGSMILDMTLKSVVFPAPLGPISECMVPGCTFMLMSLTAVRPPKRTVTLRVSSMSVLLICEAGPRPP